MTDHQQFLDKLLRTPSPTGAEMPGQRIWAQGIGPYADSVDSDAYGNTWATLRGTAGDRGLKVMLEAHADEIGFMVQYISDEGFISIIPVGGSDVTITRGKRIVFFTSQGEVKGVIGNTAIHLRRDEGGTQKPPQWQDVYIDIGAKNRQEVIERGLRVGVFGVYDLEPMSLTDKRITGRAIDNRISGYILARVFANLKSAATPPAVTVFAVNAVQEEVGGNGAIMITNRLAPDCALVFDVTHATDIPAVEKKKHGEIKLGEGPTLCHGTANHPILVERLRTVAEREEIAIQHEAVSRVTSTDTDKVFVSSTGVPSALISIPLRYMHSPVETVDLDDVEATIRLVTAFIQDLTAKEAGFRHTL
jgi:putative aminopeptidase FrvX